MEALRIVAVVAGLLGLFIYFRSIVRVLLLNRRERDLIGRGAARAAILCMHALAGRSRDYERVRRLQAWIMPVFVLFAVASWFLLVQFSFSFIMWGFDLEASWPRAFSASGSALSTIGYTSPHTLLGAYLSTYESAIGLVIVVLLFTFVPGFQAAVRERERKVGWLYSRTGMCPSCMSLLESLERSGQLSHLHSVWEGWEAWFRSLLETHSLAPILAYVPSVYRNTTWVGAAAAVLDTTSVLTSSLDAKDTEAARLCRETGVTALRLIAAELHPTTADDAWMRQQGSTDLSVAFDHIYAELIRMGLPVRTDKEACRAMFITLRGEYEAYIRRIAEATLMPIGEPWVLPHPYATQPQNTGRQGTAE